MAIIYARKNRIALLKKYGCPREKLLTIATWRDVHYLIALWMFANGEVKA